MRNIAIILAGGSGSRLGGELPKQFLPLADGRSVLEHAVVAFEQSACIDGIIVVMHPSFISRANELAQAVGWKKMLAVVPGGKERWESSVHALEWLKGQDVNVLIHDAARPFVSERIIADVCASLVENKAVTVAVPATDTMYEVQDGLLVAIPPRASMLRAQTPQAFRLDCIAEAYRRALQDPALQATDDCGIVHRYMPEQPIAIVAGEEQNRKITFKEDL